MFSKSKVYIPVSIDFAFLILRIVKHGLRKMDIRPFLWEISCSSFLQMTLTVLNILTFNDIISFLKKIVDCRNFGDIFILGNLPEVTWLAGFLELLLATVEPILSGYLGPQTSGGFGSEQAADEQVSF